MFMRTLLSSSFIPRDSVLVLFLLVLFFNLLFFFPFLLRFLFFLLFFYFLYPDFFFTSSEVLLFLFLHVLLPLYVNKIEVGRGSSLALRYRGHGMEESGITYSTSFAYLGTCLFSLQTFSSLVPFFFGWIYRFTNVSFECVN